MAISHNLSSITDNLSGFDPVAGEVDGTVIGKDYIMWQIFEGMRAFDTRITLITGSSPTPTFLQSVAGTYTSAPAKNTTTTNATIRFYMSDDPGLTQATPNAIVYEMVRIGNSYYYTPFWIRSKFMKSGGTFYQPTNAWVYESANDSDVTRQTYIWEAGSAVTTNVMANIPKCIFWKSGNAFMMMAISKLDSSIRGGFGFTYKGWSGYKHDVGAITEGLDVNAVVGWNMNRLSNFMEGLSQTISSVYNALPSQASVLVSAGIPPTSLFTFNGINNLIGGKLWVGGVNNTTFCIMTTTPIEGILIANPTAASAVNGSIYMYNSKYYLHGVRINDGRNDWRILYELGT